MKNNNSQELPIHPILTIIIFYTVGLCVFGILSLIFRLAQDDNYTQNFYCPRCEAMAVGDTIFVRPYYSPERAVVTANYPDQHVIVVRTNLGEPFLGTYSRHDFHTLDYADID